MNKKIHQLFERIEQDILALRPSDKLIDEIQDDPTGLILLAHVIKSYKLEAGIAKAVELYYDAQELRIAHANKERSEDPRDLSLWFAKWLKLGERVVESKLKSWINSDRVPEEAKWAYSQVGIGPIIASGLAAHIDLTRANTPSSVWKYAGLAPGYDKKVKGEKLPYNARLKTLCWKMGESFVKVSGNEKAVYGKLYATFKAEQIERNEEGKNRETAKKELELKHWRDNATAKRLKEGKLSDAHLHARAKRHAVKIFLSHYYVIGRKARGLAVRPPYAQSILGHDGIISAND